MNKLVIVCGPTATGKTAVAVRLAKTFNGELISADSRQVYRGMDIGTGKDVASLGAIPIWMYDVIAPDEPFSVSQYQKLARHAIQEIRKKGKLPIVVGGTGLYIQSIIQTIPTGSVKPNEALRSVLGTYSLTRLQLIIRQELPHVWKLLNDSDRKNPRRLIRKIEVGRSDIRPDTKPVLHADDIYWVGLTAPFSFLYDQIDKRVTKRVKQGIVEEIKSLIKQGYSWDLPAMSGLGYREWKDYIEGHATIEDVIQKWKHDEHGYARRQMTWFKRNRKIHWFDVSQRGYREAIKSYLRTWYNTA